MATVSFSSFPSMFSSQRLQRPQRPSAHGRHGASRAVRVPQRVYLIRRIAAAFAAIVAMIVLVSLLSTRFADATEPEPGRGASPVGAGAVVIAQPGDTLWSLAREAQPKGDVRPLVAQLARAHGGSALRAGDRVAITSATSTLLTVGTGS